MNTDPLLKSLGVLPASSGIRSRLGAVGEDPATSFDDLLEQARAGAAGPGAPIRIAKGLDLKLSPDQLQRASAAADVAEANGASRAMVLLDGVAYRLDVATRTIIGEVRGQSAAGMADVDAVVSAPASAEELATRPVKIPPPPAGPLAISNTSLRELLDRSASTDR
ncbi:MAG: hypothetical protein WCK33_06985 [Phycisphaerae bacterium]|jgi:hypothetical protein